MNIKFFRDFIKLESSGGILLALAAILAMAVKNSPLENAYDTFLSVPVSVQIGELIINKPSLLWINDGLMAVFFFLIGLELKREVLQGQLSSKEQISLPLLAAIGGLTIPAIIYIAFNYNDPIALHGWAIPTATDIAFALGVITLLGKRIPTSLKITLVAIAIIDDLAAILIIALFYTKSLSLQALMIGSSSLFLMAFLNYKRVLHLAAYILPGIFLWVCVLKSGVHATLAGVVIAMFIPLRVPNKDHTSPLERLEHSLHPWVAFGILPLFAFGNAGVSLKGLSADMLYHHTTLGIFIGLFIGKQMGVMAFTYLAKISGFIQLPPKVTWPQYYGMSILTGIGFTMSLFIGSLSFEDPELINLVRIGVISASALSGAMGYMILHLTTEPA